MLLSIAHFCSRAPLHDHSHLSSRDPCRRSSRTPPVIARSLHDHSHKFPLINNDCSLFVCVSGLRHHIISFLHLVPVPVHIVNLPICITEQYFCVCNLNALRVHLLQERAKMSLGTNRSILASAVLATALATQAVRLAGLDKDWRLLAART